MALQLLDSTLRDGGLGMEDSCKAGYSTFKYTQDIIRKLIGCLSASQIDIVELGSVELSDDDKRCFAIYQTIEDISQTIPRDRIGGQRYAALYRGPDTPLSDIPKWDDSLCELVRVIIRYSELQKSMDFCAALSDKGYRVCVQPMLTMRYTDEELDSIIRQSNAMGAYALYFVDSYGYMRRQDIDRLFCIYSAGLDMGVRIGFHAHNNMGLAYANACHFLELAKDRDVILDACIMGLGQGAGNLQTEVMSSDACCANRYYYDAILGACDLVDGIGFRCDTGYSVTTFLPALHRAAYKYALAMRKVKHMGFVEINRVLERMPYALKQRYTVENLEKALAFA